MSTTEITLQS